MVTTHLLHVVSSSGTDTYSAITQLLSSSLKGPKHGNNIKVVSMFQDLKKNVKDISDEEEVEVFGRNCFTKKLFDKRSYLWYGTRDLFGIGSRAQVLKGFVETLARKRTYERLQSLRDGRANGSEVIAEERHIYKCPANVDFTAVLFTACWICLLSCIHRFLQWHVLWAGAPTEWKLINTDKIIRPAYKNVLARLCCITLRSVNKNDSEASVFPGPGGREAGSVTARGFLDYLMEKEVKFPYVVGVSAGSCNALDYVSWQPGRTRDCMIARG